MPDYSKGKIYTIRCKNDDTLIYVGSTVQPLSKRFGGHKVASKKDVNCLIYSTINNDWTDWFIELYQEYPCENKEQLDRREGEVIREIGTLNKRIAGRTIQEWRIENADIIKTKNKEYRDNNKDKSKEYRLKNIDKLHKYDKDRENTPERKEYKKKYQLENAENRKEYNREYHQNNIDKVKQRQREYRQRKKLEKQKKLP